ncbi:DUF4924 family protein [Fulvivirga sp. M361]|uniref:DUF4924 family protein n=1 Tax=Fulvivirga sp. M361 TaxID=2594266 RepID=UPI00117A1BD9|nr:DUF4924 family protein [Fulvivirga sp. M361]TRX62212.1 DUF4924 family protein [Fulvivirga sp. M361]
MTHKAEKKKQENISEYIIYMYQAEDLIRAYNFDMNLITEHVVKHLPVSDREKKDVMLWYTDLLLKMQAQKIERYGHLEEVQVYVDELEHLKNKLVDEGDEGFMKVWNKSQKLIMEHKSEGGILSDIQVCLNGIYGLLLLRLNGKPVDKDLLNKANHFGDVLSYLSYKHKQHSFMKPN